MENSSERPFSLLVADQDESVKKAVCKLFREHILACRILHATSIAETRSILEGTVVDVILAARTLKDGNSEELLGFIRRTFPEITVVVHLARKNEEEQVQLDAGAAACIGSDELEVKSEHLPIRIFDWHWRHLREEQQKAVEHQAEHKEMLRNIRGAVSRIYHEINNPLSIISGNAQLLIELGNASDMEDDLLQPIRDIEEASRRIGQILQDLSHLKTMIPYSQKDADIVFRSK